MLGNKVALFYLGHSVYCLSHARLIKLRHLSILTSAGMPPDLKIVSRPCRWCDILCRAPAPQRAASGSRVPPDNRQLL